MGAHLFLSYPKFQAFDSDGAPLSGGKVYTYAAGTTTNKTTYSDYAKSTPNANPVVLDSRGEANIVLDGAYKIVLKDSSDTQIWSQDNINDVSTGLDGDTLDVDWNPSYYTPATTPSEASDVDDLAAHLYGIDQAVNPAQTRNMADNILQRANLLDCALVTNAIGDFGGGAQAINMESGNCVSATVSTAAVTFTFTNPTAADECCQFILFLTNGGSQTVNWPASVDWEGGSAPSLTAAGVDILVFSTIDGGTIWHGGVYALDSK